MKNTYFLTNIPYFLRYYHAMIFRAEQKKNDLYSEKIYFMMKIALQKQIFMAYYLY